MPARKDVVACPSCRRRLALPEGGWRGRAKCPACAIVFTPGQATLSAIPPDASTQEADPRRPDTSIRRRRRQANRRQDREALASESEPIVTRAGKVAFLAGMLAHAALVAFAPARNGSGETVSPTLLLAPIVGIYTAIIVLVFQTYFWPERAQTPNRLRRAALAVGFILGCAVVIVMRIVTRIDERRLHWTEIGEALLFAPLGGFILAMFFWYTSLLFTGLQDLPRLLALAAEDDDETGSESGSMEHAIKRADSVPNHHVTESPGS